MTIRHTSILNLVQKMTAMLVLFGWMIDFGLCTPRSNTTVSMSVGGAQRATSRSNSALIVNPAGMSRDQIYSAEAYYFRANPSANTVGVNIVDSRTRAQKDGLAMGLGYYHTFIEGETSEYEALLGFALPLRLANSVSANLGLTTRYRADEVLKKDGFNLDGGLLFTFPYGVCAGVVGERLLEDEGAIRRLGIGGGLMSERLVIDLDYVQGEDQSTRWQGGLELLLGDSIILRGGYSDEDAQQDSRILSMGIGFLSVGGASGQLAFAYQREIDREIDQFGLSLSITPSM